MSQLHRIPIRPTLQDTVLLDDIEFVVTYTYTAATPDVWYQNNGDPGWPGDPAEVDIHSVKLWGIEMLEAMPERQFEYLYDKVLEAAEERDFEPDDPIA